MVGATPADWTRGGPSCPDYPREVTRVCPALGPVGTPTPPESAGRLPKGRGPQGSYKRGWRLATTPDLTV